MYQNPLGTPQPEDHTVRNSVLGTIGGTALLMSPAGKYVRRIVGESPTVQKAKKEYIDPAVQTASDIGTGLRNVPGFRQAGNTAESVVNKAAGVGKDIQETGEWINRFRGTGVPGLFAEPGSEILHARALHGALGKSPKDLIHGVEQAKLEAAFGALANDMRRNPAAIRGTSKLKKDELAKWDAFTTANPNIDPMEILLAKRFADHVYAKSKPLIRNGTALTPKQAISHVAGWKKLAEADALARKTEKG